MTSNLDRGKGGVMVQDMNTTSPSSGQPLEETETTISTHTPQPESAESASSSQPRNLPCGNLLGNRGDYLNICVPLYKAIVMGDWKRARFMILIQEELVRSSITENCETALHIAASVKSNKLVETFVNYLLVRMTKQELEFQNQSGNTALFLAAAGGNVGIAKILVSSSTDLLSIPGSQGLLPLHIASMNGKYEMVNYLYSLSNRMSGDFWIHQNRGSILLQCVEADSFDVALEIVINQPELANGAVLRVLARKTSAFTEIKPKFMRRVISRIQAARNGKDKDGNNESHVMQLLRFCWAEIVKRSKDEIDDIVGGPADIGQQDGELTTKNSSQVLFIAAEMGNTKFLVEVILQYPDIIWKKNDNNQTIFHVAVTHRQEGVYNLLYEIDSRKDMITHLRDDEGNNMLHLVAKSAKKKRLQDISGVALQMQRELLWYKEVEGMVPPSYREQKNNKGLLPHELFTDEHKELVSASEKWMKDTASQCMVVSALIATMVFTAAFTVPGGYDQDKGIPVLRRKKAFIAFVISDAISLTFSTISILMFLYILTSRYAEQDFLESLPKKLMRGLASLFLSITSMMVAFSFSFFVLYDNELIWVPIVIGLFALLPIMLYARLQYDLLADVYHSTYGSTKLFKPEKPMLYPGI